VQRSGTMTFRSPIRSGQALRDAVDAACIARQCTRFFGALGGPPVTRHPPSTAACASRSPTPSHMRTLDTVSATELISGITDPKTGSWRWVSHRRSARHGAPYARCTSGRMAGRNDMAIAGRSDTLYGQRHPGRERPPGTASGPVAGAKGGGRSRPVLHRPSWSAVFGAA